MPNNPNRKGGRGKKHKTLSRSQLTAKYWEPVKMEMRQYIRRHGKGAAAFLAKSVGIANSQVHRYTCAKCEHDAEPSYSVACAIVEFLNDNPTPPVEKREGKWTRHRKGCTHKMRHRITHILRASRRVAEVLPPFSLIESRLRK